MMKLTAPILGPILAGSLALTTLSAAPAQAGSDDAAKVLFGIAALTILGAAIADSNKASAAPVPVHRAPPVAHPVHPYKPNHAPQVIKRRLPAQCQHTVRVNGKTRNVYGKDCLQRQGPHFVRLPQSCERTFQVYGRPRQVYMVNCLRDHGWPV